MIRLTPLELNWFELNEKTVNTLRSHYNNIRVTDNIDDLAKSQDSQNLGLLISAGKTSREALISKKLTKIVEKLSLNSICNPIYNYGNIIPKKLMLAPMDIALQIDEVVTDERIQ